MVTCESLYMLSLMLDGHFAMIISLEFFLPQFLSIKEVRPFEHFQPVLQPNVIRRVFQPVRSRYDAVIVAVSIMTMVVVGWRMVSLIQSEAFKQLMYLNRSILLK